MLRNMFSFLQYLAQVYQSFFLIFYVKWDNFNIWTKSEHSDLLLKLQRLYLYFFQYKFKKKCIVCITVSMEYEVLVLFIFISFQEMSAHLGLRWLIFFLSYLSLQHVHCLPVFSRLNFYDFLLLAIALKFLISFFFRIKLWNNKVHKTWEK